MCAFYITVQLYRIVPSSRIYNININLTKSMSLPFLFTVTQTDVGKQYLTKTSSFPQTCSHLLKLKWAVYISTANMTMSVHPFKRNQPANNWYAISGCLELTKPNKIPLVSCWWRPCRIRKWWVRQQHRHSQNDTQHSYNPLSLPEWQIIGEGMCSCTLLSTLPAPLLFLNGGNASLPVGEAAWRHWWRGGAGSWGRCCCTRDPIPFLQ